METSAFDKDYPDSFVSVFLGVIDPEHRIMTYAWAGHEPVMLISLQKPPELLAPTAPIVGVFAESHNLFHQRFVSLQPGASTLIVTTDGVTEARSPAETSSNAATSCNASMPIARCPRKNKLTRFCRRPTIFAQVSRRTILRSSSRAFSRQRVLG